MVTIGVSVDIPSGISADTGRVMNTAIKAECTITFGYMKQVLYYIPARTMQEE